MARDPFDVTLDEEKLLYERGIAHFNAMEFFEAHEVWEDAWRGTSGRRSRFYQGLIQMAVTLVHYQRRNGLGVRRVFERACRRWSELPDVYMGLDLRRFEQQMQDALGDVLAAADGTPVVVDPSRFFALRLKYDPFTQPRAEAED